MVLVAHAPPRPKNQDAEVDVVRPHRLDIEEESTPCTLRCELESMRSLLFLVVGMMQIQIEQDRFLTCSDLTGVSDQGVPVSTDAKVAHPVVAHPRAVRVDQAIQIELCTTGPSTPHWPFLRSKTGNIAMSRMTHRATRCKKKTENC
jgi:hypothetical protein